LVSDPFDQPSPASRPLKLIQQQRIKDANGNIVSPIQRPGLLELWSATIEVRHGFRRQSRRRIRIAEKKELGIRVDPSCDEQPRWNFLAGGTDINNTTGRRRRLIRPAESRSQIFRLPTEYLRSTLV
jgi:hypothetical protein